MPIFLIFYFYFSDAIIVVASIIMQRNVLYLHSQRSAITVRVLCTWWQIALIKLFCSTPAAIREDTRQTPSPPHQPSWGKGEELMVIHLHPILRREGPMSWNARAGHHKKPLRVSYLRRLKNKAERGPRFKKGKRLKGAFSQHFIFLPSWDVYLIQAQGEWFQLSWTQPKIFNYCWGTVLVL